MKRHPRVLFAAAVLCASFILGVSLASAVAPLLTVEDADEVSYVTAKAKGSVDPQGQSTTYRFQYVTDAQFQENEANGVGLFEGAGTSEDQSTETAEAVTATLSGLAPATVYHLRLLAENGDGQAEAVAANTFETKAVAAPTVVLHQPVLGIDDLQLSATIENSDADPAFDTEYRFEFSTDGGANWSEVEAGSGTAAGAGPHNVSAELKALEPHTVYEVRIFAKNAGLELTEGPLSAETAAVAPTVTTLGTLDTTASSIEFHGRLNARKSATTYWFEWGTQAGVYTASVPLAKDADGGAAKDDAYVAQTVAGLHPNTTYHYRLVADNGIGGPVAGEDREATTRAVAAPEPPCPNEAIRVEQHATYLPECRAWEQVSPVDKNGTDAKEVLKVAGNGQAVAWSSIGAYAEGVSANASVEYVGRRASNGGWATRSFSPKFSDDFRPGNFQLFGGNAFDEDLRTMVFVGKGSLDPEDDDIEFLQGAPVGHLDVYRAGEDHHVTWLSRNEGVPPTNELVDAKAAGISADGRSVFIESSESLIAGVPTQDPSCRADSLTQKCNLYRWRADHLEAVGYDENDQLLKSAGLGASTTIASPGGGHTGDLPDSNAVSQDGSSFVYGGYPISGDPHQLYLKRSDGSITRISSSQRSGSIGQASPAAADFVAATGDLAAIFFRTPAQLTDDAPVGGGDYRYDVASGELAFSNVDAQLTLLNQPGGFVRASDDGHRVYFISEQALATGAKPDQPNLYVQDSTIHFVAFVHNSNAAEESRVAVASQNAGTPEFTSSALSADGTKLVFQSDIPAVANTPNGVQQVYLYDAVDDALTCLSCSPSGTPAAPASFMPETFAGTATPHAISADGSRIAFTSDAALVPRDTNGVGDVYEYVNGRVHLVSDGTSRFRSFFVGMSESGADLFFTTRSSLASSDTDAGQYDVYDAHVGGGFPGGSVVGPQCTDESCLPVPTAPANSERGTGSSAFVGADSSTPRRPRCGGNTVRKGKRCVKRHARKSVKHRIGNHGRSGK